jgi:hypothetical protein
MGFIAAALLVFLVCFSPSEMYLALNLTIIISCQILVRYRGALPDLFREGHSVVAEGFVRPFDQYPGVPSTSGDQHASLTAKARDTGCYFAAIEVLAKHDEVTALQFSSSREYVYVSD